MSINNVVNGDAVAEDHHKHTDKYYAEILLSLSAGNTSEQEGPRDTDRTVSDDAGQQSCAREQQNSSSQGSQKSLAVSQADHSPHSSPTLSQQVDTPNAVMQSPERLKEMTKLMPSPSTCADDQSIDLLEGLREDYIRCICGTTKYSKLDGPMICCDECDAWQHILCMGLAESAELLPQKYFCELCRPNHHSKTLEALARGVKIWTSRQLEDEESTIILESH